VLAILGFKRTKGSPFLPQAVFPAVLGMGTISSGNTKTGGRFAAQLQAVVSKNTTGRNLITPPLAMWRIVDVQVQTFVWLSSASTEELLNVSLSSHSTWDGECD